MTDWADEEAMRLITTTVTPEEFGVSADIAPVAAALRAAHKRGMVEGLREASWMARKEAKDAPVVRDDCDVGDWIDGVADDIAARAAELEAK